MSVLRVRRLTVLSVVAVACVLHPPPARGDGGTLRYSTRTRGLDIAIFTDPTPVKTGTVDVSVYVKPIPAGETRPLPVFQVCAYPVAAPALRQCEPATSEVATNKLFRAAQLQMTQPGLWQVDVLIESADGNFQASFQLPVEDGYPDWTRYAKWIGLPVVAIVLFAAHGRLARRRPRSGAAPAVVPPAPE
jgi:hypothetical protein